MESMYDIEHALKVASHFEPNTDDWTIAILHDILEDTDATPKALLELGFSDYIVNTVVMLTRYDYETYREYIQRIDTDSTARRIKVADLVENIARSNEKYRSLRPRYIWAHTYLTRWAHNYLTRERT